MKSLTTFLCMFLCVVSCSFEPEFIDVTVVEVYQEGGAFRITKTWRTLVKKIDGTTIILDGKLGEKDEEIKVKNPDYR